MLMGIDMESIDNIIKREKFIIREFELALKQGTSPCEECTRESIIYHESIIFYLKRLKELDK